MKEISEGLRPGIPKQPLMDSCVRAVNLWPGRHASQPERADGAEMHLRDALGGERFAQKQLHANTTNTCAVLLTRLYGQSICAKKG